MMVGNKGAKEEMGKRRESERSADFPRGRYREPFTWYKLLALHPIYLFPPLLDTQKLDIYKRSLDLEKKY